MNNVENRFKTASMGGFVKSEVVSYIESMEQEYRSKLGTLEKIVAATQSSRSELEGRLQQYESGRSLESNENERLKSMLAGFQGQLNEKEQALQEALEVVERLQAEHGTSEALEARLFEVSGEVERLRASELELQHKLAEQGAATDEAAQREIAKLQEALDAQRELVQKLSGENEELRREVERLSEGSHGSSISTALLLDMQTQLDQRNWQLISMNQELDLMREKCLNYENTVGALEEAQAKANQIEAGARAKATDMIFGAAQESDKLKSDLDAWLGEIEESYHKVKQEAEQKVSRAYEELEKTKVAMDRLASSRLLEDEAPKRPSLSVIPGYGDVRNA